MTDMIPEFIVDDIDVDEPPLPFKVTYAVAGEKTSDLFHALPKAQVPYAWTLDYFAAGTGDSVDQAAATVLFLNRVLIADDRARFDQLVHDPAIAVNGKTLQAIVVYLIGTYNGLDPTRARSAGPKRSHSGRSRTSTGSTATRSATATT